MSAGYVYLLHFERPISPRHTCQHYMGSTADLATRIQAHGTGNGARLVEVAGERGIGYTVARVWTARDHRQLERRLKNRKNGPLLCPLCSPSPRPARYPGARELTPAEIEEALIPF